MAVEAKTYAHAHPMALRVPSDCLVPSSYQSWLEERGLYMPVMGANALFILVASLLRPFGGRLAATWSYSDGRVVEFSHPGFDWPIILITGALSSHMAFLGLQSYNKALFIKSIKCFDSLFIGWNFVAWSGCLFLGYTSTYRLDFMGALRAALFIISFVPLGPMLVAADACEMGRIRKLALFSICSSYFAHHYVKARSFNDLFLEEGHCFDTTECHSVRAFAASSALNIAIFLAKAAFQTYRKYPFVFLRPIYAYGASHGTCHDLSTAVSISDTLTRTWSGRGRAGDEAASTDPVGGAEEAQVPQPGGEVATGPEDADAGAEQAQVLEPVDERYELLEAEAAAVPEQAPVAAMAPSAPALGAAASEEEAPGLPGLQGPFQVKELEGELSGSRVPVALSMEEQGLDPANLQVTGQLICGPSCCYSPIATAIPEQILASAGSRPVLNSSRLATCLQRPPEGSCDASSCGSLDDLTLRVP